MESQAGHGAAVGSGGDSRFMFFPPHNPLTVVKNVYFTLLRLRWRGGRSGQFIVFKRLEKRRRRKVNILRSRGA